MYFMHTVISVRVFICAPHVCLVLHGGQEKALYPLELELWVVMSHRVGAVN